MGAGIGAAVAAAALFGAATPLAKGLLATVPPHLLGGLFYLGSGVGLTLCGALRRSAALDRRAVRWLAVAIVAGGILAPPLQLLGVRLAPASTAALLLNLEGVFTALMAWVAFGEHVHGRTAAGMVAIVAGGALLGWDGALAWNGAGGALAIAAACFLWALDNNATQQVSGQDAVAIAGLKGLVAGVTNTGLALATGAPLPGAGVLAGALVLGFLCYGLSLVLFVRALRDLGTARTGAYFALAPFVGAALSLLALGEPLTGHLVAAAALMAVGLAQHLTEHHEHDHTHEADEHAHEHVHDAHHQHAHAPGDPPGEPHTHAHRHAALTHRHAHYPDLHHRHTH